MKTSPVLCFVLSRLIVYFLLLVLHRVVLRAVLSHLFLIVSESVGSLRMCLLACRVTSCSAGITLCLHRQVARYHIVAFIMLFGLGHVAHSSIGLGS